MGEVLGGRYELLDVIGAGGMGSVWSLRDTRDNAILAGKVFAQSDAGSLLRFMRETTTRISHAHVVMPLGWAGEDDRVVFAMPLIDGGSFDELLVEHGTLPPRFVAEVMRQVLSGLEEVHRAHVVHRDVKPGNIMMWATGTSRPFAMLGDFGIAAELNGPRLTRTHVVMGTPGYLAPEVLRGSELTAAQDVFGAGAVMYRALSGRTPPRSGIVTDLAVKPDGVPTSLWSLVAEMLCPDPLHRPSVADAQRRLSQDITVAWNVDNTVNVPLRLSAEVIRNAAEVGSWHVPVGVRPMATISLRDPSLRDVALMKTSHIPRRPSTVPVHKAPIVEERLPTSVAGQAPGVLERKGFLWGEQQEKVKQRRRESRLVALIAVAGGVLTTVGGIAIAALLNNAGNNDDTTGTPQTDDTATSETSSVTATPEPATISSSTSRATNRTATPISQPPSASTLPQGVVDDLGACSPLAAGSVAELDGRKYRCEADSSGAHAWRLVSE